MTTINETPDIKDRIIDWLLNGDTGASSRAIVEQMLNPKPGSYLNHPRDYGDFDRCIKLLELLPEFAERIDEMSAVSPEWAAIVAHWDYLTESYRRKESLQDRIREILEEIRD